jgi:hypothetical protein
MKLHFTIRDLLWLTLVVAMGVGWWLREQQLRSTLLMEVDRLGDEANTAKERAVLWRAGAGALEHHLRRKGCNVEWDLEGLWVTFTCRGEQSATTLSPGRFEPSVRD